VAPPWQAEAHQLHGTLAWLAGQRASARTRWQASLDTAEKVGMPVERARTLLEMGERMDDVALVDEAMRVFERAGARLCLALGLHARARLEPESSAADGTKLQRYDAAIHALAEMKAERALGAACRERARLHGQRGDAERAREDLMRARACFDAVGDSAERAEIERDTAAL
jgi:hypothetical protein